jgi:hypothetical protein
MPNGNGRILVGPVPYAFREEQVTGYLIEKLKDLEIVDAVAPDLLDESAPISGEAVIL